MMMTHWLSYSEHGTEVRAGCKSLLFLHNNYSREHLFQVVSVPEFDGRGLSAVKKFESNQLPANTPNEDRRSAATCLQVCTTHAYLHLPSPLFFFFFVKFNLLLSV